MPRDGPADHLGPHQFQPGQSGNPAGRPPGRTLSYLVRLALADPDGSGSTAKKVVRAWVKRAIKGSYPHLRELLDRTEGRVPRSAAPPAAFDLTQLTQEAERKALEYRPAEPPDQSQ